MGTKSKLEGDTLFIIPNYYESAEDTTSYFLTPEEEYNYVCKVSEHYELPL